MERYFLLVQTYGGKTQQCFSFPVNAREVAVTARPCQRVGERGRRGHKLNLPVLADLRPMNNTKAGLLRAGKLPLDRYCHRVSCALFYHLQDRLERERARAHTNNCKCMFKATHFRLASLPNGNAHAPARASDGTGAYIYARARARAHERLRTHASASARAGDCKCSAAQ